MAKECDKTAGAVHAHAFSIVAGVAGAVVALIICAALLFVFYDGRDDFAPSMLTNAAKTGESAHVTPE